MALAHHYHQDPSTGMALIPLPANLLPVGAPLPAAALPGGAAALRSTSLTRMADLSHFLAQCDDPTYTDTYNNLLQECPDAMLQDFAQQLRNRAKWLEAEQAVEYKRAKAANVLHDERGASGRERAPSAADSFFASRVLGSVGQHLGAGEGAGGAAEVAAGEQASLVGHLLQRTPQDVAAIDAAAPEAAAAEAPEEEEEAAARPARAGRQTTLKRRADQK